MLKIYKRLGALLLCMLLCCAAGCSEEAIAQQTAVRTSPHPSIEADFQEVEPAPEVTPQPGWNDVPTMSEQPEVAPTQTPEVSPTAAPTSEPTAFLLKEEMEGDDVTQIQQRLKDLGYMDKVTGYYGTETTQAVRNFQQAIGITADGTVGSDTRDKLMSPDADAVQTTFSSGDLSSASGTLTGSGALAGKIIGLDPGHQGRGSSAQEPIAPGSSETKARVTSGTEGVSTGVAEYVVNLDVGLKLRDLLEAQGATVVMSRETHDVDISNAERATKFNEAGADLVVRLHCDGEDDQSRNGAFVLIPVGSYAEGFEAESRAAAQSVLDAFIAATGANNLGLSERDDQTGFNWSEVPVINIEMGHMSNPAEDQKLVSPDYQQLCAEGIAQGIINYFS